MRKTCNMIKGLANENGCWKDDNLLFIKVDDKNCEAVVRVLHNYFEASGQIVNFNKLALCISPSVDSEEMKRLAQLVGMKLVDCHERYIGLPYFSGRSERILLAEIVDKVWNMIKGCGSPKASLTKFKDSLLDFGGEGTRKPENCTRDKWVPRSKLSKMNFANVFDLLCFYSNCLNKGELEIFSITFWKVWCSRNNWVHNGKYFDVSNMVWWSMNYIDEIRNAGCRQAQELVNEARIREWLEERDVGGRVVACCSQVWEANYNVGSAKAMAIWKGICFGREIGLENFVMKTDSESVINHILKGSNLESRYGGILDSIGVLVSDLRKILMNQSETSQYVIGVRMMGLIETKPFMNEMKKRFTGYDFVCTDILVQEILLNVEDERLKVLEVYNGATKSMFERHEYNPSGGYAVPEGDSQRGHCTCTHLIRKSAKETVQVW
ncbi:hypothetical protein Ddye_028795 [Dipteronia dyeriana]|uniref:RNase H type-1 domain-containing protein n=1 Tax=Dipteronia dyeriana TaxID=168575 RepID=A0AAD9TDZ1_9ROSI|nr:hypothetical protein Ddye_028795 [Dipteronia dyeriana]